MADIKKLPLFARCVIQNFPFIENDFDALTNYQLISKVVEFLNKIIKSQNEVIDATNDLQENFLLLHDYVENYFKNLDVQEEINNKLDQMAETGALETIIVNYFKTFQIDYETFGAVGDGVTDDYNAIRAAHEYANEHNLKVVGAPEKTYYVKDFTEPVIIKTDVDWNNCKFIIDDSDEPSMSALFEVKYDHDMLDLTNDISSLVKDQTKCSLIGHGDLIVRFENSNKKDFIRTGSGADSGSNRREYTRINDSGAILDGIYFPFDQITSIQAYQIDKKEITIENAEFTTVCNEISSNNYYNRGINVTRSNVTFKNIRHILTNETDTMSPYNGIFYITFSSNIKLIDCYVSGHKTVQYQGNNIGSYDINMSGCIDCELNNVQQINSITDSTLWSVHGSNYCKDITFNNCQLSNIDAHRGIKNLYINNCIVGGNRIGLCGWGEVKIKNTTVHSATFCRLRNDYGSWFDGTIEITDCKSRSGNVNYDYYYILSAEDTDISHNYGYKCFLPNLKVRNFTFDATGSDSNVFIYKLPSETNNGNIDYSESYENQTVYPHLFKDYIDVDGVTCSTAYKHLYLFRYEAFKIYTEKTGITYNKSTTKKMSTNIHNFDVNIKNVTFNPNLTQAYTSGDCDLWTSRIFNPTISDGTATHYPVMNISLTNCINLHLDSIGRSVTFNLTDCIITHLQRATGYANRTLCNCDHCTFEINHGEDDNNGFIYARNNTYCIKNSTFNITGNETSRLASELILHVFKTKNGSAQATNTVINCSINTTIDLASYFETLNKYYGIPLDECYNTTWGTLVFRKSGSDGNIPTQSSGVVTAELGDVVLPIGSQYINPSPFKLYIFNGSEWNNVLE